MNFDVYTHGFQKLDGLPTPRLIQEVNKSLTGYVDGWHKDGQWRFSSDEDNVTETVRVTVRPRETESEINQSPRLLNEGAARPIHQDDWWDV